MPALSESFVVAYDEDILDDSIDKIQTLYGLGSEIRRPVVKAILQDNEFTEIRNSFIGFAENHPGNFNATLMGFQIPEKHIEGLIRSLDSKGTSITDTSALDKEVKAAIVYDRNSARP